jgi:hypothetical protein
MKLSKTDRKFLHDVGITPESVEEDFRVALAKRIAKHQAPAQVKLSPEATRLQLIELAVEKVLSPTPTVDNPTLDFLKAEGLPLNRENYLHVAYLGDPPELDAEREAELPWEVRLPKGARLELLKEVIVRRLVERANHKEEE